MTFPFPGFIQTLAIEDFLLPVEYALPRASTFFFKEIFSVLLSVVFSAIFFLYSFFVNYF